MEDRNLILETRRFPAPPGHTLQHQSSSASSKTLSMSSLGLPSPFTSPIGGRGFAPEKNSWSEVS